MTGWQSIIGVIGQLVIWPVVAANVVVFFRARSLIRRGVAQQEAVIAELNECRELHYTLNWIFVCAARNDRLPWWRMWSASMQAALRAAAEREAEN